MKLDFSKFKKIQSDDKCTVLQHPSGNSIKISHRDLSPDARKQIEDIPIHLAKGGFSKYSQKYDPNMKAKNSKPAAIAKPAANETPYNPPKMAKNSYTEPDDQGAVPHTYDDPYKPFDEDIVVKSLQKKAPPFGPIGAEKPMYPPCINPSCKSRGRSHPNCRCYGGNDFVSERFAEGGKVDYFCSKDRKHQKGCEYFVDGGMAGEKGIPDTPVENQDPQNQLTQDQSNQLGQSYLNPQSSNTNPNVESGNSDFQMAPSAPQQDVDNSVGQSNQNTDIPQDLSTPSSSQGLPQEMSPTAPSYNDLHQQYLGQEQDEDQKFQNDLSNGHITPKTYKDLFADKSTLGKIGTIFGLMVGGAGAGLAHQPNMLMQMMDSTLQRDFEAQKQSKENAMNFHRIAQQGVVNQAHAGLLNAQAAGAYQDVGLKKMMQTTFHDLASKTSAMPEGPTKQAAMNTLGALGSKIQDKIFNMNDAAASTAAQLGMKQNGTSPSGPVDYNKFNDLQLKSQMGVLGAPSASDLESMKNEAGKVEQVNSLENDYKNAFNILDKQFAAGKLSPNSRKAVLQGLAAKAAPVVGVNHANGLVESMMPQASDWGNTRNVKQQSNAQYFNVLRSGTPTLHRFGVISDQQSQSAQPTKTVNGIKYMRGPNGEAIKVK